jgi:hypothetical protein
MHARWSERYLSQSEIYMCEKGWKVGLGQGRAATGEERNANAKCICKPNSLRNAIFKCNTKPNSDSVSNANAYAKCARSKGCFIF